MRHLCARQRESDKRWDFTSGGRKGAYPVGYCAGYREFTADDLAVHDQGHADRLNAEQEPFREKYHTDGHATKEKACACYREYLLDMRLQLRRRVDPDALRRCEAEGCDEWTGHYAQVGSAQMWHLCDEHLNRDTVDELMGPISEIWSS